MEIFRDDPQLKRFITGVGHDTIFKFDEVFKKTYGEVISFKMSLLKQAESESLVDNKSFLDLLEETFNFGLSAERTRYKKDSGKDK